MCEHGIKHEVGLTTCSAPPCTMRYRGLLWDSVGARGILCLLRLILSSSCNAVGYLTRVGLGFSRKFYAFNPSEVI